jgi:hypothetical protein
MRGREQFDSMMLRIPVLGPLFRKVAVAKFTRTFSTLVKSGVPILVSLEIVGKTSGNTVIEKAVESVRTGIKEGENIADPLAKSGAFPPIDMHPLNCTSCCDKITVTERGIYEAEAVQGRADCGYAAGSGNTAGKGY